MNRAILKTRCARPSFVTVTLHPAIDRTVAVETLRLGELVRGELIMVEAAGKGINVTHTLANLGRDVLATGFVGKQDAGFFLSSLPEKRVTAAFVEVNCATRENLTIIERVSGRDTHITSSRMKVSRREVGALLTKLRQNVRRDDWAVFTGSCPRGLRQADFVAALRLCKRKGAKVCVDTSGPLLRRALGVGPWLIKPNREELEELTGRRLRSVNQIRLAAEGLLSKCARVLVSLGAEGAVLVTPDGAWHAHETRHAKVTHTVGAGDALLAGYLAACAAGEPPTDAVRFAVACGSACVRSPYASIRSRREVSRLIKNIVVCSV